MGSRAVVLGPAGTRRWPPARFGISDGMPGVVYTRTGRPFFAESATELLGAVRHAVSAAGPLGRARHRLAAARLRAAAVVGEGRRAAARPVRPGGRGGLGPRSPADDRVLDRRGAAAGSTRPRLAERPVPGGAGMARRSPPLTAATAGRLTSAGRRQLAPFQVLATEGAVSRRRDHDWHLALLDRLCRPTPR